MRLVTPTRPPTDRFFGALCLPKSLEGWLEPTQPHILPDPTGVPTLVTQGVFRATATTRASDSQISRAAGPWAPLSCSAFSLLPVVKAASCMSPTWRRHGSCCHLRECCCEPPSMGWLFYF